MQKQVSRLFASLLAVAVCATISYLYLTGLSKLKIIKDQENLKDKKYVEASITLKTSNYGKEIYEVNASKDVVYTNMLYQEVVEEKIKNQQSNTTDFNHPFMIYNPYGTNKNSLNIYFETKEEQEVEYTVKVEGLPDFRRTLKNEGENNLTKNHAYQIIGLVVGKKNNLLLKLKDNNGTVVEEKEWTVDLTSIKPTVATKLKQKTGTSKEELSDGLYVMFGHDKAYNANNYLYDNEGVLRSELILDGYRSDRIIFLENSMIYSNQEQEFIKVNRLGKIEKRYSIGDYVMHHDYILDEENENLIVLANKKGASTIEDRVISLNLNTGKVKELIDMKDYLKKFHDIATVPEKNTYGGTELDWIHLNSLDIINGKDLVLSSRELSTIIYMEDVYTNPKVKYIITDDSTLEKTDYQNLNYQKIGDFVSQAGQHTITYEKKEGENKYYLYMYNNNYQGARTRPDFNWKNYKGTGTYEKGENSYYYKYLIDEENKTYELVEKIVLPYSSIVSSVEHVDQHFVTSSGMSHCFNEYDQEGQLIKEFQYTSKKYAYRIFKYTFNNIWFS